MTVRINHISGPRNISTAMMYSFRSRADTTVVDEPLYGHFLRVKPDVDHPGRAETMASMQTDGEAVIRDVILGDHETPVVFFKNMAHHIIDTGLDLGFLDQVTNVLLIRDPAEMLPSLLDGFPSATATETGFPQQVVLLRRIVDSGAEPIVLDSKQVLLDPPGVLAELCRRIGIPWDPAMLSWEPGPKPEDGVWSVHWYHRLHETTGFAPYVPKDVAVPEQHQDTLQELQRCYAELSPYAIEAQG